MTSFAQKINALRGRPSGESFENVLFSCCDFACADLSGLKFENCVFEDCRFSAAAVQKTLFNGVKFIRCQMRGLNLRVCYRLTLSVGFEDCLLEEASFYGLPLRKTLFANCSLRRCVFTEADLSGAVFARCDLSGAFFHRTRLEKTDFVSSFGFVIDPDDNFLRKAKFSSLTLAGLLQKYDLEIE